MVGELNFLVNRRGEAMKLHGGTQCLVKVCCQSDSLFHVMECFGYSTKYNPALGLKGLALYLVDLNRERNEKFQTPLIYCRES